MGRKPGRRCTGACQHADPASSGEEWRQLRPALPPAGAEAGRYDRRVAGAPEGHGHRRKNLLLRKSEEAIQQAHRRIERRASKKQTKTKPETWEYAKYVVVFTTDLSMPTETILEWYRVRWQIELTFKRLKSLAQLGHLPKYDAQSSRAWLYGKLFVALLTQKLVRIGREISPWGYVLARHSPTQ